MFGTMDVIIFLLWLETQGNLVTKGLKATYDFIIQTIFDTQKTIIFLYNWSINAVIWLFWGSINLFVYLVDWFLFKTGILKNQPMIDKKGNVTYPSS